MKNRKKKLFFILLHWEIPLYAQSISFINGKNNDIVIPDIPNIPLNILGGIILLALVGYYMDILCPILKKNIKFFHKTLIVILILLAIPLFILKQLRIDFYDWLTVFSYFLSFSTPPLIKNNNHKQIHKQKTVNNPEQNNEQNGHNNTQNNKQINAYNYYENVYNNIKKRKKGETK